MNCPTCPDERLAITDRQGIEVDYCPACRGIWLDRGELDKLLDRADAGRQQRPDDRHRRSEPIDVDDRRYDDDRNEDRYDERGGSRRRRLGMLSDLLDFG
ncbi:MAG TPA: zf-TFIIB domain-containing protein [Ilumatobacteraceae bacterium]